MPADPYTTFNFLVQLEVTDAARLGLTRPLCNMEFAECDGLEMTMEPKTFREGGNNTEQLHLVGPVSYGSLTLRRGMTTNLDLWKWFAAATGNSARGTTARGIVTMRDNAHEDQIRFVLSGCLPIKMRAPALNAKDGLVAIEEMQLAYRSFTVETVTGGGAAGPAFGLSVEAGVSVSF